MPPEDNGFRLEMSRFCGTVERALTDMEKEIKEMKGDTKEVKGMMASFQESVGTLKIKVAAIGAITSLLTSVLFLVVKTLIAK